MFILSDTETASIHAAYESGGELAAAAKLRRLFPGITDMAYARRCALMVAGWRPVSATEPPKRTKPRGRG